MRARTVALAAALVAVAGGLIWKLGMGETPTQAQGPIGMRGVVPTPASVEPDGTTFTLTAASAIVVTGAEDAVRVGEYLAKLLRPATGYPLPVRAAGAGPGVGNVALRLDGGRFNSPEARASITAPELGDEGYALDVAETSVTLRANAPVGLFRGVQTLRQLFPPSIERSSVQSGPWSAPGGRIVDRARFAYRGIMLDVARHFFAVADVKRVIEFAALLKLNHLHLHLTDDQGWRLAIDAWPRLSTFGGATEVGAGPGGYYTKDDYREIVAYAQAHFVTVVPEIDLPGHTNAALASYPELNCDGRAPERYTGIEVGFSALCAGNELTYRFLDDVFGEIAAMTPGPYLHIGGDEAKTMTGDDYATVVGRAQEIVNAHEKTVVGWHEIAAAKLMPSTVVQFWGVTPEAPEVVAAAAQGNKVIMSPADRAYLDMKYDEASPLGLSWAGLISVRDSYDWDPVTHLRGLDPAAVLGVESPLWTETVHTMSDIEYLAFPRLASTAEIGWSPVSTHDWGLLRGRLAAQGLRWEALGIGFYRSPEVAWGSVAR